jgi:hypothetical protein
MFLEADIARELAEMVKEHVRKEIAMAMQPLLERLVSAEFEIRAMKVKESLALPKAIAPDDDSWRGPGHGKARLLSIKGAA